MAARNSPLVVGGLAVLVVLASFAELILSSWSVYYLNTLQDQVSVLPKANYSNIPYNTPADDPDFPPPPRNADGSVVNNSTNTLFTEEWIFPGPGAESFQAASPRIELAAAVISFVLGLLLCGWTLVTVTKKRAPPGLGSNSTVGIVSLLLAAVITVLFAYIYAAWGTANSTAELSLDGLLDEVGYDAWPTWETWTCAVADLIDAHPEAAAVGPEWRRVCTVQMGARWTLIPVFVFAIAAVVALLVFWSRASPPDSETGMKTLGPSGRDEEVKTGQYVLGPSGRDEEVKAGTHVLGPSGRDGQVEAGQHVAAA